MSRLPPFPVAQADDLEIDSHSEDAKRDASGQKMKRLLLNLVGRWYWIVLGTIIGFLGASYYLSKAPKVYSASATLLIKQQVGSIVPGAQAEDIDPRSLEAMNTVAERIRRLDLMESVASRSDVRAIPGLVPQGIDWTPEWIRSRLGKPGMKNAEDARSTPPPPAAVLGGMIAGWTNVSIRRFTRLIDISVTHQVPEVSKALADAIAREYLAEIDQARNTGSSTSIDLLQKEVDQAGESIQEARGASATYSRALEAHRLLEAKETEVATYQRRYLPKHPKMASANADLAQLQERFLGEFDVARQAVSDKAFWDGAAKEMPDRATAPADFLRTARQQLLTRSAVLESEIASLSSFRENLISRVQNSSVNKEAGESSAEVSNLARVPGGPSAPVAEKVLRTGTMGGMAFGLAIALLFIRIDNKYHTVAQIAGETGVTVLAAISDIKPHHLAVAERQYRKRHPLEKTEGLHENWDELLVFRAGLSSTSYAEMYRVLRASISLLGDETRRKVTLFSSALPGEGKTSTSANFALAAAGQGRRTLLIDLDLRKPSVHKMFGLAREREKGGITECLANLATFEDVIVRATGQENLHLILSGKRAPNPGELLDITRLKAIFAQACREYDVVVLDTAPLLAVPDTRIIAPLADNVCLVARADYVPKGAVRRVLEVLDEDGTKLSGLIFNGFSEKRRLMGENYSYGYYKTSRYGRAYRYGYGAYGAYGEDEDENGEPKKNRRKGRK